MFRGFASLLRAYRQNQSDFDFPISSSDSEDESELEESTTAEALQRSPPLIGSALTWPVSETQMALSTSPFANLPIELLIQIFRLLPTNDLGNVSLVCRYFKMIAGQDDVWRPRCNPIKETPSKPFKQVYVDWIYGKYLRRRQLKRVNDRYRKTRKYIPCLLDTCHCSSDHLLRAKDLASGFVEHPSSSSDMTIELSVDIDRTVIALIALLEKTPGFVSSPWRPTTVEQMIMRYYRFMQLKAAYPKEHLIASLDIEIVWQTHLLRPEMYHGDCLRLFGRVIDHALLLDSTEENAKEQAFAHTCRLYEEHFHEQYCPSAPTDEEDDARSAFRYSLLDYIDCPIPAYSYWDETSFSFASDLPDNYENPFSFVVEDIILDSYWFELYCAHMYEVGIKIMAFDSQAQPMALQSAMKRLRKTYERFLYLTAKYSTKNKLDLIHPTCAIDIVWHSHMQQPLKYANDCLRLVGFVMDHVPWLSTKSAEDTAESYEKMHDIWKAEFDREMTTDHLD